MSAVPQAIIVGQRLHLAVWGQMDNAKRRYPACGGSPSDGKIQRQNAEKNFTVRFTVKKICLEAIEADRWRKAMDYSHSIISWRHKLADAIKLHKNTAHNTVANTVKAISV